MCQTLENSNQRPVLVLDVVINGDDEHEDKEDPSPAKKVPDVMPEKTVSSDYAQEKECTFVPVAQAVDRDGGEGRRSIKQCRNIFWEDSPIIEVCAKLAGLVDLAGLRWRHVGVLLLLSEEVHCGDRTHHCKN